MGAVHIYPNQLEINWFQKDTRRRPNKALKLYAVITEMSLCADSRLPENVPRRT